MHPWKSRQSHNEPPKDPEIHHWFQALGTPPVGHAPPDLRANVRTRIEQLQAHRGVFAWVPSLWSPTWAAAVTAVLVVSLGLNIWWGVVYVGRQPLQGGLVDETVPGSPAGRLSVYQFQVGMAQPDTLRSLLAARPALWGPMPVVGFTPQAARTTFVRMGTLYADALAELRGGAAEAAAQRLDILAQAVTHVQAPSALPLYLRSMQAWVQQRSYDDEVLAQFLALFEPLYEEAYTRADMAERVTLFRAGAWLENLALAAAIGDRMALKQGGAMIEEVRRGLARLPAPPGVSEMLERVRHMATARVLTDQEVQVIRTLVRDVQYLLSE